MSTTESDARRMAPGRVCALAILIVPATILIYVWITQATNLQTPEGSLDVVVPAVTGIMFVICLWNIWRSSWSLFGKAVGSLGALIGVAAGAMIALMVLFGRTT